MEVAVAAVLIAVLAAATIPSLSEFMSSRDAAATASKLEQIGAGLTTFKNAVLTGGAGTNTYPRFISSLSIPITTSNRNSCYGTFNATAVNNWAANGPFVSFYIPVGGLNTPLGVVQDSMLRNPSTSAQVGTLAIRMTVDSMDGVRLDRIIDGGDGPAAGVLRITAFNGTGSQTRTVDIQYLVPVAARC